MQDTPKIPKSHAIKMGPFISSALFGKQKFSLCLSRSHAHSTQARMPPGRPNKRASPEVASQTGRQKQGQVRLLTTAPPTKVCWEGRELQSLRASTSACEISRQQMTPKVRQAGKAGRQGVEEGEVARIEFLPDPTGFPRIPTPHYDLGERKQIFRW